MNFIMTKIAAALTLAMITNGAYALSVNSVSIADTINNSGTAALGDDVVGADGKSGAHRFGVIDLGTYTSASLWAGDLNGGLINMAGGAPLEFTTGAPFAGARFQPFNAKVNSGIVVPGSGDITWATSATADAAAIGTVLSGSDLIISNFEWAFNYALPYTSAWDYIFAQSPDAGSLVVQNLIKTGANSYAYRLTFQHDITSADDPTLAYTTQTVRWVLEGNITTAVPEASTYGMMLSGLGLVGAAVARRRRTGK